MYNVCGGGGGDPVYSDGVYMCGVGVVWRMCSGGVWYINIWCVCGGVCGVCCEFIMCGLHVVCVCCGIVCVVWVVFGAVYPIECG